MKSKKQVKLKTPYAHLRDAATQNRQPKSNSIRIALAAIGVVIALIFYNYPNFLDMFTSKSSPSCKKYALMVDAGSTGSRIHVYRFHQCNRQDPVRLEEEELFAQTQPGLSAFADAPHKAAESLDVLLKGALELVPASLQKKTPIAVKATAGLRLLGEGRSKNILEAVHSHLDKYPFPVIDVSMMDGKDEGVYAWITVNFLLGNFADRKQHSAAVLDLGGGSTQIVFEPDRLSDGRVQELPETESKYSLHFDNQDYMLYQNSYLGYGLMEARKRMHQGVMSLKKENKHACLPHGMLWEYTKDSAGPIQFNGTGSFEECILIADTMLNKDKHCALKPCSFDGIYQPAISESFQNGPIYIFSYFHDRTQPLGLPSNFKLPELKELTQLVCSGAFLESTTDVSLKGELLDRPEWCLDLSFIYRLLSYGYEIPDDRVLTVAKKIDDVETGWCLGAAIAILGDSSLEHID
ncbi:nucleoside phosphatase GDA1/CD39 [Sporodiniella umbellata]|nr:nucleoside phosphatase GDA1/CD39 [Sporodiniella umbellata]